MPNLFYQLFVFSVEWAPCSWTILHIRSNQCLIQTQHYHFVKWLVSTPLPPIIGGERHYVGRSSVRLSVVRQHLFGVTRLMSNRLEVK